MRKERTHGNRPEEAAKEAGTPGREAADPRAAMLVAVGMPVRHERVEEAAKAGEEQPDVADDPRPQQVPDARRGREARVNVKPPHRGSRVGTRDQTA